MGAWKYRKPEPATVRGVCVKCLSNQQKPKAGGLKFNPLCSSCDKKEFEPRHKERAAKSKDKKKRPYRVHVKDTCDSCGFHSNYKCQFDVDHIDGNHNNNEVHNLQTLCANCHRLKTFLNKDWEHK